MLEMLSTILLSVAATGLVLLVLAQRGTAAGVAGSCGTKAGDVLAWATIVTAAFWILLCCVSVKLFQL